MDLVYKDESYKIVGILYKAHRILGENFRESDIQKVVAEMLKKKGFKIEEQVLMRLPIDQNVSKKLFFDILIDNKIVLEIKAGKFHQDYFKQVKSYVVASDLKLGLLATFSKDKVIVKRIPNLI